ncbi:hypothetical protein N5J53_16820 [Empedobacter sp. GD03644]|uniref:hypothetical protein n=1 Tax=Empedobacter sp. GD03644 TaxID=2975358 RepID=UPI0024478B6C|nr:hypothetical protein [Empedobacter sp. GD03644]MDH2208674.1 hypothetical protein [Empedobacter sp. GD03644]
MIKTEIRKQLSKFFQATKELQEHKIIRSSKYTGDIAEYLCKEIYGLTLCESQREIGYDAIKDELKYQIKINNSSQKTNQEIGNPEKYDVLLLLITSESKLFNSEYSPYFITLYKIESKDLFDEKYIAKTKLSTLKPEILITEDLEVVQEIIKL